MRTAQRATGDSLVRAGGAFKRHHGAPAAAAAESAEVFGVCGAACAMPRHVFEELGNLAGQLLNLIDDFVG